MPSDPEHDSEDGLKEGTEQDKSAATSKEVATKRRTKSGCLTCRKRRIKCGEERPICKNCIKSKRDCAGYNHPLVYKQHARPQTTTGFNSSSTHPNLWTLKHLAATNDPFRYTNVVQPLTQSVPTVGDRLSWTQPPMQNEGIALPMSSQPGPQTYAPMLNNRVGSLPEWSQAPADNTSQIPVAPDLSIGQSRSMQEPASTSSSTLSTRYSHHGFIQRSTSTNKFQPLTETFHHNSGKAKISDEEENSDDPWDIDMEDGAVVADTCQSGDISINAIHELRSRILQPSLANIATSGTMHVQRLSARSPLHDEKSQKIFKHFLTVTGPCMGTFERHEMLGDSGLPKTIWTYGLPNMAFKRPALAHAILAIGAIHMAKLNLGSENTAVKHFTHALRRIGHILGNPKQRLEVSTLATVLLLGYYEVLAGDHSRWNLHLSGAGKLVMEHNYAGTMRTIRRMRSKTMPNIAQPGAGDRVGSGSAKSRKKSDTSPSLDSKEWDVDQTLISRLMGCEVNYDTQIQPNFEHENFVADMDQKSLDEWRVLTVLYWWYCRQDIFMSMLSGDPLLLSYRQWKYCPPRGPIDNADNPSTTLDHMWLIIARVTDFGGKDRKRKQSIVNLQGGQWIPTKGFHELNPMSGSAGPSVDQKSSQQTVDDAQRPPSANEGRARKAKQSPPQPAFYGMMPPVSGPIQMPSSFNVMNAELRGDFEVSPVDAESPDTHDLDAQTRRALVEHVSITDAFDLFESSLSHDYQPLPNSDIQITTPFGPALQYKSSTIAAMWAFYYVGRILLRRVHPYSPPAAMMSAGVNARATHEYAQRIGRICGGLFAQHNYLLQAGHVDHNLSAAVMQTTFSLLFAAVQYQDRVQRGWTIGKLSEIAQITGWQTSAAIAAACEATWERAGRAGRGPPYQRTLDQNNADDRLNGKYRYSYSQSPTSATMSPTEEHESRFVSHDRSLIDQHASTRAHWALGLLSVEEDMRRITVKSGD